MSLHNLLLASLLTPAKEGVMPKLGIPATRMNRCKNRALTFDMSGGPKGAKRPLRRPLDEGVSSHGGMFAFLPKFGAW